jgi:PKD repeat protein
MGKSIAVTIIPNHDIAVTIEKVDPTQVAVGRTSTVTAKVQNLGNVDEIVDVFVYMNGIQVASQTNLRLTAGNFRRVSLAWFTAGNTTVEGNYNVTVYAPPVAGEVITVNNMHYVTALMKLLPVAYFTFTPASPQISEVVHFDASPSYAPGVPGGSITEYLWDFGDNATDTGVTVTHAYTKPGSWSVRLTVVDDEGLNSTGTKGVQVPKLTSTITIASSLAPVPLGLNTTISGSISPLRAGVNVLVNSTRFDGNVTTTVANLTSTQQGQYSFVWVPEAVGVYGFVAFWSGDNSTAEAETSMLNVTVVLRDLVLARVSLSEILVSPGGSVQIDVTAMNKGTETVDFNVNVYYNDTLLETQPVDGLAAGGSRELNFEWDTTGVDEGVYLVRATVDMLQGEANAADNSVTTGIVVGTGGVSGGLNVFMYTTIALIVVIAAMAIYMLRTTRGKGKEPTERQDS